jgi:hypothetical protein
VISICGKIKLNTIRYQPDKKAVQVAAQLFMKEKLGDLHERRDQDNFAAYKR